MSAPKALILGIGNLLRTDGDCEALVVFELIDPRVGYDLRVH